MNQRNFTGLARRLVDQLRAAGVDQEQVLEVIAATPRQQFMPESLAHQAWDNTALPIGNGQTISQPYIVAKMTSLLTDSEKWPQRVLEIGTGSGYQTAILAQLVGQVYSVERISQLQYQARRRLRQLDLHNVRFRHGDGWEGWPGQAPFDGILVTAAAPRVPAALVEQLSADGGRMVLPVGTVEQELVMIERQGEQVMQLRAGQVRFVPLVAGELQ